MDLVLIVVCRPKAITANRCCVSCVEVGFRPSNVGQGQFCLRPLALSAEMKQVERGSRLVPSSELWIIVAVAE